MTRLVAIAFPMCSFVSDILHPKLLSSCNQRVLRLFPPSNQAWNGYAISGGLKFSIRVVFAIGGDVFGGYLHWNVVRFVRLCASSGSTNIFFLNPWTAKIREQSSPIFHLIFICTWQKFWWHCMVLGRNSGQSMTRAFNFVTLFDGKFIWCALLALLSSAKNSFDGTQNNCNLKDGSPIFHPILTVGF